MKIILFLIAASMMITTSLDAMHPFKTKKSPTEKCWDGIEFRNQKKVKHAIKKGADPNLIIVDYDTNEQTNLLQLALSTKHIPIIRELLKAPNLEINSYPIGTMPPLHCAVYTGKSEIIQLLLAHPKTDINILDGQGNTCLFTALNIIFAPTLSIGKTLLDNKLDITIANKQGDTILHCISKRSYTAWFELTLTTKNPPLNVQNERGDTPLHILCRTNAYSCVEKILSSKHIIDFSILNNDKCSVFDIVLDNGYDLITSLFLDKYYKECISIYRNNKRFFGYAVRAGNEKVLQEILPSSYVKGEETHTPLMVASENGHIRIVELLLEQKNCNPLQANNLDQIALHYAARKGHLECVQRLYKYGGLDHQDWAKNTPLHVASINSCINVIDYLVEQGANILIKNANDFVPFLIIYQKNIQDKIKETTLNRMIQERDKNNNSLFHIWAEISHISDDKYDYDNCLQFLAKKGLNIHARNNNGLTALDIVNNQQIPHFVPSKTTLSFWCVVSDNIQYDLFKEILDVLPKDLRIFILILYYKINIETILAKIYTKVSIITDYLVNQKIKQELQDDLHYFPLLYRQAVLSYE